MKVNEKFKVKVLQEGGNMPAEPATQAQPSPEQIFQQILQLAAQATQSCIGGMFSVSRNDSGTSCSSRSSY